MAARTEARAPRLAPRHNGILQDDRGVGCGQPHFKNTMPKTEVRGRALLSRLATPLDVDAPPADGPIEPGGHVVICGVAVVRDVADG